MQQLVVLFLFLTLFSWASPPSLYEIEPNNTPVEATPFSGEVILTGTIKEGDQDAFMWEVTQEDALYDWSIELVGVSHAMTRIDMMHIDFSADGKEVEDYHKFFSFGTKTGNKPVTLPNLLFKKGSYLLAVTSKSKELPKEEKHYQIIIKKHRKDEREIKESSKQKAQNIRLEDNNNNEYTHYTFSQPSYWFTFEIDKQNRQKLWRIDGIHSIGHEAEVTLLDETHQALVQTNNNQFGKFSLSNLELDEGKYYLHYVSNDSNLSSGIKVYSIGNQKIDKTEIEPNNRRVEANTIHYAKTIHGKVDKQGEYDYFSFVVPKKFENKVFDIEVQTEDKESIIYLENAQGKRIQEKKAKANFTIKNLQLRADEVYYLVIYGRKKDASYHFKFSDFREVETDQEIEPNDKIEYAYGVGVEQNISGYFQGDEYDCFRFTIEKPNKVWSMYAMGETLARLQLFKGLNQHPLLTISNRKEKMLSLNNLLLLPGDYKACIDGENGAYYFSVNETPLSALKIASLEDIEHEPNQNKSQTNELKFGQTIKGMIEHQDNEDYFHFTLKNDERIRLTATPPKEGDVRIKLISDFETIKAYPKVGEVAVVEGVYPPGRYIIDLWSQKPSYGLYAVKLERLNFFESNASTLDIQLKIINSNDSVAAYSEMGQKMPFNVEIEVLEDMELNISSHVSDRAWSLDGNKTFSLKAKEQKKIPFVLEVPKNVGTTPVVTTLKFSDKEGAFKTIALSITPKENATVLNPYNDWGMPEKILGGLNVARLDMGAKRVLAYEEKTLGYVPDVMVRTEMLFDNAVYKGKGFHLYDKRKVHDENISIALAGKGLSEIIGVILNPVSEGYKKYQLKDFSISLSEDGKVYTTVYRGTLGLEEQDQAFVFDKPYKAKYARLTLHNSYEGKNNGNIALGEWKVIAKQESVDGLKPFNLASPALGGHVVKSSHDLGGYWNRRILSEKEDVSTNNWLYKRDKILSWVVGFKNERMAKVTKMVWKKAKNSTKESHINDVKVLVSTQTPNGPWRAMKVWHKKGGQSSSYVFDKPTWVRYVKFVVDIKKDERYALPETLEIIEEQPSTTYHSILGEWGEHTHRSFYEYQHTQTSKALEVIEGNERQERAYLLEHNQTILGRVSVANHEEDWYKVIIPKGDNQLHFTLSGESSVDVDCALFEGNGTQIEPNSIEKTPLQHHYVFEVKEQETYYLKVVQPPISVVFAWDNSGSVSPYHAEIFSAVNNYTQKIEEKIDAVNLLCFNRENRFIFSDFLDNPMQIQTIFNNFDRDCSDSDAERPLRISSAKLKNREGTKGVIIIGDAVGSPDKKLWSVLEEVNPKVFSIRVQSQYNDNELYEGIMQSWTRVNNGTYNVVSNGVELYRAIHQASAILRRPVYYELQMESRYVRPLGDGSLKVLPNRDTKVDKNLAIELILDASGSMLKRIDGVRRIAIAREVLQKAVKEIIPDKTPVALRVFGHKRADSCQTDLEMRLQPLNVKVTSKILSKINAKNLAKTPIADSLAKVADDLRSIQGKKVVILVTDGEETCDGDPAKEIERLKDKGIDVRINIVGFSIDDEALKETFKAWAKLGDGAYFEAKDKNSLEKAIKKALQVPYRVYNKQEQLVAEGIVGVDEIKLKGGTYKVVVESSPQQIFKEVFIVGERSKTIQLKDTE